MPTNRNIGLPEMLTPAEVAEALQVSERSLYNWRRANYGPPFVLSGRSYRYPRDGFDAWVRANTRQPTELEPRHTGLTDRERSRRATA